MVTLSFRRLKMGKVEIVCLFVLMFNITFNNFSVMSGGSQRFLGITSASRGVNMDKNTTRQGRYLTPDLLLQSQGL